MYENYLEQTNDRSRAETPIERLRRSLRGAAKLVEPEPPPQAREEPLEAPQAPAKPQAAPIGAGDATVAVGKASAPEEPLSGATDKHSFWPMIPPRMILDKKLTHSAQRLGCWLYMQARGNPIVFASQALMMKENHMSKSTIQRGLNELEGTYIETLKDAAGNSRDNYRLPIRPPRKQETP